MFRSYSNLGLRDDADFLFWFAAKTVEEIQIVIEKLYKTVFGKPDISNKSKKQIAKNKSTLLIRLRTGGSGEFGEISHLPHPLTITRVVFSGKEKHFRRHQHRLHQHQIPWHNEYRGCPSHNQFQECSSLSWEDVFQASP